MEHKISEISTEGLKSLQYRGTETIVDIRKSCAYNGWQLQDEQRGGHIAGAINFPAQWLKYEFELPEFLKAKGIIKNQPLTLYGYNPEETRLMAERLVENGYGPVKIYNHFVDEYCTDTSLKMNKLPKYKNLVYPQWLQHQLNKKNNNLVLCHAHYDNYDDYLQGHIPGSIALSTLELEDPETWNRRTPDVLRQNLLKHGITADTTVVLYGRFSYPRNEDQYPGKRAGQLAAMRCAAIMLYAGVKDVRILDGSILAWENEGYPIASEVSNPVKQLEFGADIPAHPEIMIDTPKAKELLKSKKGELVSIRSWDEFIGEVSGYNYIDVKGRIPGAIFGNCGTDAYHMENYRNPDLTVRAMEEVQSIWAKLGITPDKHIAFYCGTGWRGSEAFINAWLMGWPNISVYDGGWMEWSSNPENPIETGEPATMTKEPAY